MDSFSCIAVPVLCCPDWGLGRSSQADLSRVEYNYQPARLVIAVMPFADSVPPGILSCRFCLHSNGAHGSKCQGIFVAGVARKWTFIPHHACSWGREGPSELTFQKSLPNRDPAGILLRPSYMPRVPSEKFLVYGQGMGFACQGEGLLLVLLHVLCLPQ